jgi:hypothetical protein
MPWQLTYTRQKQGLLHHYGWVSALPILNPPWKHNITILSFIDARHKKICPKSKRQDGPWTTWLIQANFMHGPVL